MHFKNNLYNIPSAGLVSLGAYIPAKPIPENKRQALADYLKKQTLLDWDYIDCIVATGKLPGWVETNADGWENQPWYQTWFNHMSEKNQKNPFRGTKERRRLPLDPSTVKNTLYPRPMIPSDAETLAAALALFNSGLSPDEIDLVIVKSKTVDRLTVPNAPLIQHKLKLRHTGAFDLNSDCASSLTLLDNAAAQVSSGRKKNVLIVDSSLVASYVNDKSHSYGVLFGDAVVAGIVSQVEPGYGYIASESYSDGVTPDAIILKNAKPILNRDYFLDPQIEQYSFTYHDMRQCEQLLKFDEKYTRILGKKVLEKAGLSIDEIGLYTTIQPFFDKIHHWKESLGVPDNKFFHTFEKYGHCLSSSVGLNLIEAIEQRRVGAGDYVLSTAPGSGATMMSLIHRITQELATNTLKLA